MSKFLNKISNNSRKTFKKKLNTKIKKKVLKNYYNLINKHRNKIISENKKDIKVAKIKKLKENFIKRLALSDNKINSIIVVFLFFLQCLLGNFLVVFLPSSLSS